MTNGELLLEIRERIELVLSLSTAGHTMKEILQNMEMFLTQKLGSGSDVEKQINNILDCLRESNELFHLEGSFHPEHHLKEYIDRCWAELQNTCPLHSTLEDEMHTAEAIYHRIIEPKDTFDYHRILQMIDKGRQDILKDLTS